MLQTTGSLIQHDPSGSGGAHNMLRAIHSLHASKAIAPSFWVFWAFRQMNWMCYLCYRVGYKSEANATRVACIVCCINLRRGWGVHFQSTGPSWWLRLGGPQGGILTSWSFFFWLKFEVPSEALGQVGPWGIDLPCHLGAILTAANRCQMAGCSPKWLNRLNLQQKYCCLSRGKHLLKRHTPTSRGARWNAESSAFTLAAPERPWSCSWWRGAILRVVLVFFLVWRGGRWILKLHQKSTSSEKQKWLERGQILVKTISTDSYWFPLNYLFP